MEIAVRVIPVIVKIHATIILVPELVPQILVLRYVLLTVEIIVMIGVVVGVVDKKRKKITAVIKTAVISF